LYGERGGEGAFVGVWYLILQLTGKFYWVLRGACRNGTVGKVWKVLLGTGFHISPKRGVVKNK